MPYNPSLYMPQSYSMFQTPVTPVSPLQQMQAPQMMTPPTIRAEIVQVDNEQAASTYPVGAGASQMMIARDDSAIYVKTASTNGYTLDVYEKRPQIPAEQSFDPKVYVHRDELKTLVTAILEEREAIHESI